MSAAQCKLLVLLPTLSGGGAERAIATLLRHFDRSRFALTLGVVDTRKSVFHDELPTDVAFVDLQGKRVRYTLFRIVRLVWQLRPDVVLSTLGHLNIALALLRPLLPTGVRLIGRETMVVSEGLVEYSSPRIWRMLYRLLCHRLDHLICQSKDMRDDLERNFAVPASKLTLIHNPVDLVAIKRQAEGVSGNRVRDSAQVESVHLVAAGRLVSQKGFDLLIEAVGLCSDLPLRVTVLGDGPLRTELEALARKCGATDRMLFAGFQRNPYPILAAADALVLSSRYEGLPNIVLEALACGTPVIATPAPGGVRELLEGIDSCELADEISAPSLAKAIRRWVARRPTVVEPGAIESFSADKITKAYEATVLRVAGKA